jgi:hypothetical protein
MMNDSTRVMRRSRLGWPRPARTAAAIIAAAALALLAEACSGSLPSAGSGGSPDAGGSANSQKALAYSACMRSHGVAKYPDASSSNELPSGLPKVSVQQLGVSGSQYQAAQAACAHLLPNGGQMSQAQSQRDLRAMLGFARCMRSHGVPNWPDPTNGPAGWGFNLVHVQGFDPNSPQIDQKMSECSRRLPAGIGVPLSRPGRPG